MNFDEAISAHVNWKTKLRALCSGQGEVDAATLGRDDVCVLGKWLNDEGARYSAEAQYRLVKDAHLKFHRVASKVAELAKSGKRAAATAMLDGVEYGQASMAVVKGLGDLRKRVGN